MLYLFFCYFYYMKKDKEITNGVVYAPYIPVMVDTKTNKILKKLSDDEIVEVYSDLMYDIYYRTHKHCPNCGSDNITSTCVGYIREIKGENLREKIENFTYKDKNKSSCNKCGWVGVFDDLK